MKILQHICKIDVEECIATVYYHSFPSAVLVILILCKDYGYCEYHLCPVQPDHSCNVSFRYTDPNLSTRTLKNTVILFLFFGEAIRKEDGEKLRRKKGRVDKKEKEKERNELVGQYFLPVVTNETPLSWTVFLGCSACLLRHTSRQGDLFSP